MLTKVHISNQKLSRARFFSRVFDIYTYLLLEKSGLKIKKISKNYRGLILNHPLGKIENMYFQKTRVAIVFNYWHLGNL